jgi:hypothetical protein
MPRQDFNNLLASLAVALDEASPERLQSSVYLNRP